MKYLYKILRLFFCPHKWVFIDKIRVEDSWESWTELRCQCKYCGKFRRFK